MTIPLYRDANDIHEKSELELLYEASKVEYVEPDDFKENRRGKCKKGTVDPETFRCQDETNETKELSINNKKEGDYLPEIDNIIKNPGKGDVDKLHSILTRTQMSKLTTYRDMLERDLKTFKFTQENEKTYGRMSAVYKFVLNEIENKRTSSLVPYKEFSDIDSGIEVLGANISIKGNASKTKSIRTLNVIAKERDRILTMYPELATLNIREFSIDDDTLKNRNALALYDDSTHTIRLPSYGAEKGEKLWKNKVGQSLYEYGIQKIQVTNVKDAYRHELGHAALRELATKQEVEQIYDEWDKVGLGGFGKSDLYSRIETGISIYAATSADECFAEMFTIATRENDDLPDDIFPVISSVIKRILNDGKTKANEAYADIKENRRGKCKKGTVDPETFECPDNESDSVDEKQVSAKVPKVNVKESYLGIKDSSNFDINTERNIISSVHTSTAKFWNDDSKEVSYLRARDGLEKTDLPENIDTLIIFDDQNEYYGRGLGGNGGAKVWWNPYSSKDRFAKVGEYERGDGMLDPIMVLAHELHHGYGHDNELDLMSKAAGLNAHLDLGMKYANDGIEYILQTIVSGMFSTFRDKQEQRDSAAIFRTMMNNDEKTFEKYLRDHKIVNDEANYDYMRYGDVKARALSFRMAKPRKTRDMTDAAHALFLSAKQNESYVVPDEYIIKLNYKCQFGSFEAGTYKCGDAGIATGTSDSDTDGDLSRFKLPEKIKKSSYAPPRNADDTGAEFRKLTGRFVLFSDLTPGKDGRWSKQNPPFKYDAEHSVYRIADVSRESERSTYMINGITRNQTAERMTQYGLKWTDVLGMKNNEIKNEIRGFFDYLNQVSDMDIAAIADYTSKTNVTDVIGSISSLIYLERRFPGRTSIDHDLKTFTPVLYAKLTKAIECSPAFRDLRSAIGFGETYVERHEKVNDTHTVMALTAQAIPGVSFKAIDGSEHNGNNATVRVNAAEKSISISSDFVTGDRSWMAPTKLLGANILYKGQEGRFNAATLKKFDSKFSIEDTKRLMDSYPDLTFGGHSNTLSNYNTAGFDDPVTRVAFIAEAIYASTENVKEFDKKLFNSFKEIVDDGDLGIDVTDILGGIMDVTFTKDEKIQNRKSEAIEKISTLPSSEKDIMLTIISDPTLRGGIILTNKLDSDIADALGTYDDREALIKIREDIAMSRHSAPKEVSSIAAHEYGHHLDAIVVDPMYATTDEEIDTFGYEHVRQFFGLDSVSNKARTAERTASMSALGITNGKEYSDLVNKVVGEFRSYSSKHDEWFIKATNGAAGTSEMPTYMFNDVKDEQIFRSYISELERVHAMDPARTMYNTELADTMIQQRVSMSHGYNQVDWKATKDDISARYERAKQRAGLTSDREVRDYVRAKVNDLSFEASDRDRIKYLNLRTMVDNSYESTFALSVVSGNNKIVDITNFRKEASDMFPKTEEVDTIIDLAHGIWLHDAMEPANVPTTAVAPESWGKRPQERIAVFCEAMYFNPEATKKIAPKLSEKFISNLNAGKYGETAKKIWKV